MSLASPLFLHHGPTSFAVDATAMGIAPDALDALPWSRAFAAMEALEAGAVANADEGRQVGHYWLRAPERAPTMGQAAAIGDTADDVRTFAAAVRNGETTAPDPSTFGAAAKRRRATITTEQAFERELALGKNRMRGF